MGSRPRDITKEREQAGYHGGVRGDLKPTRRLFCLVQHDRDLRTCGRSYLVSMFVEVIETPRLKEDHRQAGSHLSTGDTPNDGYAVCRCTLFPYSLSDDLYLSRYTQMVPYSRFSSNTLLRSRLAHKATKIYAWNTVKCYCKIRS